MPTTIVSTDIIINTIVSGNVDAALDSINNAIRLRRKTLDQSKGLFMNIGDTIVFNTHASPKYLQGQTAIVKKVNEKTVVVDIPEDAVGARRYRGAKNIRCPFSIVDKV